jgi:hypothetical protein
LGIVRELLQVANDKIFVGKPVCVHYFIFIRGTLSHLGISPGLGKPRSI